MGRLINYLFLLGLIYLFVLESGPDERVQIAAAFGAALLFFIPAFLFKWLTLDGAIAALMFGTVVLGLGSWPAAVLVLTFFMTSTLLSRTHIVVIEEPIRAYAERERRDGNQVWANGFWFSLFILFGFFLESELLWIGAAGSIATATADTWATELGSKRYRGTTYRVNDFKKVQPGTDGGVSVTGTLGALAGSLLMAAVTVFCYQVPQMAGFVSILLAGFSGCFVDSYLGATLQRQVRTVEIGPNGSLFRFNLDNNFVNWAATGVGSLVAIITNILIL